MDSVKLVITTRVKRELSLKCTWFHSWSPCILSLHQSRPLSRMFSCRRYNPVWAIQKTNTSYSAKCCTYTNLTIVPCSSNHWCAMVHVLLNLSPRYIGNLSSLRSLYNFQNSLLCLLSLALSHFSIVYKNLMVFLETSDRPTSHNSIQIDFAIYYRVFTVSRSSETKYSSITQRFCPNHKNSTNKLEI